MSHTPGGWNPDEMEKLLTWVIAANNHARRYLKVNGKTYRHVEDSSNYARKALDLWKSLKQEGKVQL
jgi:hypothetical protein